MDRVTLRTISIAAAASAFIGLSPLGAQASEREAAALLPSQPAIGAGYPWTEMDLAPETVPSATLDTLEDWTGLMRAPQVSDDEAADALPTGNWLSDLIERAKGIQRSPLENVGGL